MELTKENIQELYNSYKWVTIVYSDATRKHLYTTTNEKVSARKGLDMAFNSTHLFDYRLEEWCDISEGVELIISNDLSNVANDLSKALYMYI